MKVMSNKTPGPTGVCSQHQQGRRNWKDLWHLLHRRDQRRNEARAGPWWETSAVTSWFLDIYQREKPGTKHSCIAHTPCVKTFYWLCDVQFCGPWNGFHDSADCLPAPQSTTQVLKAFFDPLCIVLVLARSFIYESLAAIIYILRCRALASSMRHFKMQLSPQAYWLVDHVSLIGPRWIWRPLRTNKTQHDSKMI